jgi:hypothetical protein
MSWVISLPRSFRVLVMATMLILSRETTGQPAARSQTDPLPVSATADGEVVTVSLPGGVPVVMVPARELGESCVEPSARSAEKAAAQGVRQDCWITQQGLTYRQWGALMGEFPSDVAMDANLDEPIESLSFDDVAGEKGFVNTLQAYESKFASASGLKFDLEASVGEPGAGIRLMTSAFPVKGLRPISEAACTFGNPQSMSCGQTKSGSLSVSDCTLGDGSYADLFAFQGNAGDSVTIDLAAPAFDAYLILWNPSGSKVAEDDDSGIGLNSQITFTLTSTGTWYIGANALSVGSTGSYTLSLHCASPNNCPVTTISCGAQLSGTLSSSDCLLGDGSYADLYQFAGTAGQVATVDLTSTAFDAYTVLIDPDGNIAASDDDGGTGTNSRIAYTLSRTGTWRIIANSLHPATGGYSLHLACSTTLPSCGYSINSSSTTFSSSGGNGTVQITGSPSGCSGTWSSQSNAFWITITGGGSGSGSGTSSLSYSVASNTAAAARTGTLTVAGRTFTVTQAGATVGPCTPTSTRACLLSGRFSATVRYRGAFDNNPADTSAFVKPVTGFATASFETAFFYFNSDSNIEVLLKMLDQGNTNSGGQPTIAVLFGTATPLRVELVITDSATGVARTFSSEFNAMRGTTDFTAFLK